MRVQLRWLSLGLALMAMVGLGTVATGNVFAQDATPTPSATTDDGSSSTTDEDTTKPGNNDDRGGKRGGNHGDMGRGGMGMGSGHVRGVDMDALATFLGVTTDDITTALRSGSSLADIAEANGKTRDELKTFLVEQYTAGLDAVIDATFDGPKSDDADGVGGTDDSATPTTEATPAASAGFSA